MLGDIKNRIDDHLDRWRVVRYERDHQHKALVCAVGGISVGMFVLLGGLLSGWASHAISALTGSNISSFIWGGVVLVVAVFGYLFVLAAAPRRLSRVEARELEERIKVGIVASAEGSDAGVSSKEQRCPWCGYELRSHQLIHQDPAISKCSECGDLVHRSEVSTSQAGIRLTVKMLALEYSHPGRFRQHHSQALLVLAAVMITITVLVPNRILAALGITGYQIMALCLMLTTASYYYFERRGFVGLREKRQELIREAIELSKS